MNTNDKGKLAELKCLTEYVELGYKVLIPFGQNARYDFVIEKDNIYQRVQVKTGRIVNGVVRFQTSTTYNVSKENRVEKSYDKSDIDCFIVWVRELNEFYVMSVEEARQQQAQSLRLTDPKNNHSKRIKYAKDYKLRK